MKISYKKYLAIQILIILLGLIGFINKNILIQFLDLIFIFWFLTVIDFFKIK